ncbi:hypothetical protein D3C86_2162620 [compost metagenome]
MRLDPRLGVETGDPGRCVAGTGARGIDEMRDAAFGRKIGDPAPYPYLFGL